MATYYVRADGTVSAANKANATSPLNANTSLSRSTFQEVASGAGFSDNDVIVFSGRGGQFNITSVPDTRLYFQGGVFAPIFYASETGDNVAVFDGGGAAGAGPLIYMSSAEQRFYDYSGIKLQNCNSNQFCIVASKATAKLHHFSGNVVSGNTYIEGTTTSILTVEDVLDFDGFTTHWIGMHDSSVLNISRCKGIGGKANAVHSIDSTSVTANDCDVTSPLALGTVAFALEGSGNNVANNNIVRINRDTYKAYRCGNGGHITINNPITIFGGSSGSNCYVLFGDTGGIASEFNVNGGLSIDITRSKTRRLLLGQGGLHTYNIKNHILYGIRIGYADNVSDRINLTNCCRFDTVDTVGSGVVTISSNITSDPKFVSSTDYHLRIDSPLIGAGTAIAGLTTDIEGNPLVPPYNIGPFGMATGVLDVAPVANDGPPRNNITRITGASNTINPTDTYKLADTNACRIVTEWVAGTANFAFDANGVPVSFVGQQLIDAGIGYQLYYGQKGVAGYAIEQDAKSHKKIVKFLRVNTYLDSILYDPDQDYNW